MSYGLQRCANMNHGRANSMVKFCPTCGESLNKTLYAKCDQEKHAARRKSGDKYCIDCGQKLSGT